MSNPWHAGFMQPRMAMNAAQHTIVNLLKIFFFAHQFLLVFVYLTCGLRQLFFFQCGPETPKGWTALDVKPCELWVGLQRGVCNKCTNL